MQDTACFVRKATRGDIAFIIDLIERVQQKLIDSGSLQQIGPVTSAMVADLVGKGNVHILAEPGRRLGSVFVEPVTRENFPYVEQWELTETGCSLWFLRTLAIEPAKQGRGLGYIFLDGIKSYVASLPQPAMLFLDCWAGNDKLRAFYTRAGFQLHGVYPTEDFSVAVFCYQGDVPQP